VQKNKEQNKQSSTPVLSQVSSIYYEESKKDGKSKPKIVEEQNLNEEECMNKKGAKTDICKHC